MKQNISAIKAKFFPCQKEDENENHIKDIDILDHIEKINEISSKYGIDKCLVKGKYHLNYVCTKLGISPVQGILFSHFMERSENSLIQISEIAESINCSMVRMIKYMNDCDELEMKKLIRCRREDDGIYYRIPREVYDSLRKNNEYTSENNENLTFLKFFTVLERIFDERKKNELSYNTMQMELLDLINQNKHLRFCKKITSYNLDEADLILLLCFCHLFVNNGDDNIRFFDISFLYNDKYEFNKVKQDLANGSHILRDDEFIMPTYKNGFIDPDSWKLSEMAKNELLSELNIKENRNYRNKLVLSDTIKPKRMFYNSRETGEIQKLISLLYDENYRKIKDRLEAKNMKKGFACLFTGPPGTGKTETAYQIARETKRNIMMVDISDTKSMWFGESEKKIKEIFDTYKIAVENSSITPILLINEADAVIGKRKEFSSSNQAIDQTENTIQNIILQEMENLSGILIATTNLVQNMDKAFERRFLYKINFDKPSFESRLGIWTSLLSGLAEESARELSSRFELSGGQIENIARKTEVDNILNGSGLSLDILADYCRAESLHDPNTVKRIGFTYGNK